MGSCDDRLFGGAESLRSCECSPWFGTRRNVFQPPKNQVGQFSGTNGEAQAEYDTSHTGLDCARGARSTEWEECLGAPPPPTWQKISEMQTLYNPDKSIGYKFGLRRYKAAHLVSWYISSSTFPFISSVHTFSNLHQNSKASTSHNVLAESPAPFRQSRYRHWRVSWYRRAHRTWACAKWSQGRQFAPGIRGRKSTLLRPMLLMHSCTKVSITYTSTGSAAHSDLLVKSINSLGNGSSAIAIKADLRDPASPEKIVAQTIEHFGESIDILVNNAGVELVKPIKDVTVADFGWVYDLNVRAPMLMLQAILPYLRAPGRIINISSVGARHGFKNLSVYCSSNQHLKDWQGAGLLS